MPITQAIQTGYQWGMYQHANEIRSFCELLASHKVRRVLEIGCHRGGTAALFCELVASFSGCLVLSVDLPNGLWGGIGEQNASIRDRNLSQKWPHFRPIRGDSHDFATVKAVEIALAGEQVDLLFIDGDHSLTGVWADYDLYREFVRPGGLIAFHDILVCERHTRDGVEVPKFWSMLEGRKTEFIDHQGWGGIGVLHV